MIFKKKSVSITQYGVMYSRDISIENCVYKSYQNTIIELLYGIKIHFSKNNVNIKYFIEKTKTIKYEYSYL